ncbi:putative secreted protein [Wickerhamomyces ciferrii]|uniref:Secreted protein n=1 Tax=Wickerhamomyces ciferrii (strain ATCC 14091 / BCRC 22168 / CBS 111 / JCM 3599 / NBRC 0793 / NRRL Y-1031 F-60-10) TaxID=1206466 RepID=K0KL00_WICCF|nr:uncharacterized protein BN7_1302 [Wickerhamomyces ciferrii]CCH41763.1 putative secreted protein [Wickerhamomyces ciferrii]
MAAFVLVGAFFLGSSAASLFFRSRRIYLNRTATVNQIIPLSSHLNKITVIKHDNNCWLIKNPQGVKIYEIRRVFDRIKMMSKFQLQLMNKKALSTINSGLFDGYIYLHNVETEPLSPMRTTPSVLKMTSKFWSFTTEFKYGTNLILRWSGLTHFEIITKNKNGSRDHGIDIHERAATVRENNDGCGYTIYFTFEKINLEILLSTFIVALTAYGNR